MDVCPVYEDKGFRGIVSASSANWRNRSKKNPNSQFREMCQVLSFLLLIFNSVYFISNLNLAAGDQIFASSVEQPVLLLIPDFTFCSVYTKLNPMEVVRLFAWFPEGISRADKCFLRCMLRKWGLFVDAIGRKWNIPEVSKYLFSIGTEWRRKVEASSAVYMCEVRHENMTTKYGCKNAFNFFFCLYNHGMSFLLTEQDISDYRKVYEALHPYPADEYYEDSYEEETQTPVAVDSDEKLGEDYDEPVTDRYSSKTLTTPRAHNVSAITILNSFSRNEVYRGLTASDVVDLLSTTDESGQHSNSILRKGLHPTQNAKKSPSNITSSYVGGGGGHSSTTPRFRKQSNHNMKDHNTRVSDVWGDNNRNTPRMDIKTNHATTSKKKKPVSKFPAKSRSTFSGKNRGLSTSGRSTTYPSSSFDNKKGQTVPLTTSENTEHWSDGVKPSQNTAYSDSNNPRFNSTGDQAGGSSITEPKSLTIPPNLTPFQNMNNSDNATVTNVLVSRENDSLQETSRNSSSPVTGGVTNMYRYRRSGFLDSYRRKIAKIGSGADPSDALPVPISFDNSSELVARDYSTIRNEFWETENQGAGPITG